MRIKRVLLSLLPLTLLGVLPSSMQSEFPCTSITRISGLIGYNVGGYNVVSSNITGTFTEASCTAGGPVTVTIAGGCNVLSGQVGLPVQTVSGSGNFSVGATIYCAMSPTTVTHFICVATDCCSCGSCDGVPTSNLQETWKCQ